MGLNDLKTSLREGLIEAYKHKKYDDDTKCVICGKSRVPIALHVIEYWHPDNFATPFYFVPMSHSNATLRGSVPICDTCCPPCSKCSLPIATKHIEKIYDLLVKDHKNITFRYGQGICKHIHIINDIGALFKTEKLAIGDYDKKSEIKNEEISFYFRANPKDLMWGKIDIKAADSIQTAFLEIWQKAELEKYSDTNKLPDGVIEAICELSNLHAKKGSFMPAYLIIMVHQYIDADQMMRQINRNKWVASMVARSEYAPPPESYVEFVKSTYFSGP